MLSDNIRRIYGVIGEFEMYGISLTQTTTESYAIISID